MHQLIVFNLCPLTIVTFAEVITNRFFVTWNLSDWSSDEFSSVVNQGQCLHCHTFILILFTDSQHILHSIDSSMNKLQSKSLVMMSVSLHTQTKLHCLIIWVLNTRVCFIDIWYTSLTYTVISTGNLGWQLSQRALVHSIWITQPPLSKSELEVTW